MCLSVLKRTPASNVFNSKLVEIRKLSRLWFTFSRQRRIFVISRCCFAEDGKEIYQELWYTLTATALSIKPFIWRRFVAVLRPCYTKQFFLQLATHNTPFCNCNCCVASCKKSRTTLYFFAATLRDKLLAWNIPSAAWKVFYSSSLRCKLQEKLLRVSWP